MADWTFLTNHGHVLVILAREPSLRLREVAERVGITERAAQRIVRDLEEDGYLTRRREGRRNRYEIHSTRPMRHPAERDHLVSALLAAVGGAPEGSPTGRTPPRSRSTTAPRTASR